MTRKRITAFLLVILLLVGSISAQASGAGGPDDPLVSLSYAAQWGRELLSELVASIDGVLRPFYLKASANAIASLKAGDAADSVALASGGTLRLSTGSSVTLVSGSAEVAVNSGAIVNVSVGVAASNGRLNKNQRYIVCENGSATVTATSDGVFIVDGPFSQTNAPVKFSDVKSTDWFYTDVYNAVELGLVDGMTETAYMPAGNLTVAQAIKISACMHELHNSGSVTLQASSGADWYRPFVEYAVSNGVVESAYGSLAQAQYNAAISRREYVHIFYRALPESEYAAVNTVSDNAIPDVKSGDKYAPEIYAFYRAGILEGSGQGNAFLPDTNIARSEVAAILTRMFDAEARKTVSLP